MLCKTIIHGAFAPNIKAVAKVGGAMQGIIITIVGTGWPIVVSGNHCLRCQCSPLWSYIDFYAHFLFNSSVKLFICPKQETQEYTKTVVRYCLDTLQTWFDAIGFIDEVKDNLYKVFIHRVSLRFLIALISLVAGSQPGDVSPAASPLLCHVS